MIAAALARSDAFVELSVFADGKRIGHAAGRLGGRDAADVVAEKLVQVLRTAQLPNNPPDRTVEGDFAALLLALDADKARAPFLALEFGTSTAIALVRPGTGPILTAEVAGPLVFEGEGVRYGRGPFRGAIDRVAFSGGALRAHVVGDRDDVFVTAAGNNRNRARGICGPGLVTAAAALRAAGLVDKTGKIQKEITLRDGIGLTPDDMDALAASVASVRAAIDKLQAAADVPPEGLETFVTGLGESSAVLAAGSALGLWPAGTKVSTAGNLRLRGAEMLIQKGDAAARHDAIGARLKEIL